MDAFFIRSDFQNGSIDELCDTKNINEDDRLFSIWFEYWLFLGFWLVTNGIGSSKMIVIIVFSLNWECSWLLTLS